MTWEILLLFLLLALAMTFFFLEWLSVDVVTLFLLSLLVLFGILSPGEAFSGFASEIIIILASMFVLSAALLKTGVMDWLGKFIHDLSGGNETKVVICVMVMGGGTSAFLSNTTATAVLMPAVTGLSRRIGISPGRLLIPLAFSSMLGGTCTLIGTSTNLAASGLMQKMGIGPFSLFEFLWVGLAMLVVGTIYMSALGYRLLPKTAAGTLTQEYEIDRYLSELAIPQDSPLVGKTLEQAALSEIGLVVLTIVREGDNFFPQPFHQLCEGDVLIVQASRKDLLQAHDSPSLHIRTSGQLDDLDLVNRASTIVESILMPQSTLIGRTLKELTFRQRFGVSALALYRRGHALVTAVADLPLRVGDVLLLQGQQEQFESLRGNRDLWVLAEMQRLPFRKRRGTYALIALLLAVTTGGSQVLPLSVAFLLAALSVIALKCVTIEEAYSLIEWRLIILIGGMTSFGMAMQKTHAAEYLAHLIVDWTLPLGLYFALAALVLLTMLLTQPMSNAAAALVVLPVALSTASQLQVDPRSVAVLITLSASLSFVAPFEPACMLVYGPGKYRFRDFIKSGLPLSVMVFIILMLLVPILWPLE